MATPTPTAPNTMDSAHPKARRVALLAGASGLVGHQLALHLLDDSSYSAVHSLVRKPLGLSQPKLAEHVVQFDKLPALPACDDVYIALGTTIKLAGSQAAFRAVDLDAVVTVGTKAKVAGASRICVVSSMGASSNSFVFYNRVKGEMEAAIADLGFERCIFVRPSFIDGDRASLAQSNRPGEGIALKAFRLFKPIIPANYRTVSASDIAKYMVTHTANGAAGVHVILSGQLQGRS